MNKIAGFFSALISTLIISVYVTPEMTTVESMILFFVLFMGGSCLFELDDIKDALKK